MSTEEMLVQLLQTYRVRFSTTHRENFTLYRVELWPHGGGEELYVAEAQTLPIVVRKAYHGDMVRA